MALADADVESLDTGSCYARAIAASCGTELEPPDAGMEWGDPSDADTVFTSAGNPPARQTASPVSLPRDRRPTLRPSITPTSDAVWDRFDHLGERTKTALLPATRAISIARWGPFSGVIRPIHSR